MHDAVVACGCCRSDRRSSAARGAAKHRTPNAAEVAHDVATGVDDMCARASAVVAAASAELERVRLLRMRAKEPVSDGTRNRSVVAAAEDAGLAESQPAAVARSLSDLLCPSAL